MLDALPSEYLIILCIDNYPQSFSDFKEDSTIDMKQSDTCGLVKELNIKVVAWVILMTNIDI